MLEMYKNVGKTAGSIKERQAVVSEIAKASAEHSKFVDGLLSKFSPEDRRKVLEGLKEQRENEGIKKAVAESYDMLANVNDYDDSELNVFSGLGTGCATLDNNYLYGFRPGQLIMVGGGSGLGKTTVVMHWCLDWVLQGKSIAWFALEDDVEEEMGKFKPMVRGRGLLEENLASYGGSFKLFPVERSGNIRKHPDNFKDAVRAYKILYNTDVVVLDMLNNVVAQNSSKSDEIMDDFLHSLRDIAIELDIVVIVTSMMREASGINAKEKFNNQFNPSYHEIYGMSTSSYAVQKVITLSKVPTEACPNFVDGQFLNGQPSKFSPYKRYIAVHVPKIRQGRMTPSGGEVLEIEYGDRGKSLIIRDKGFYEW